MTGMAARPLGSDERTPDDHPGPSTERPPSAPDGAVPASEGAGGSAATARRRRDALLTHALFVLLLLGGLLLRTMMQLGFHPAFAWPDSTHYLDTARTFVPDIQRPSGYSLFLRLIPFWRELWPVALVQHLLGLGIGVLIYLLLRRRSVPAWGAALATAPVVLDPWQITVEHDILSDTLFEALVLGACALLTWRRRVTLAQAATAGLLLGLATTVRSVGLALCVPVALGVVLGQARWRPAIAVVAVFALPIVGYAAWFHSAHGVYALSSYQQRQLYGRVATFVHCERLTLPDNEAELCPRLPVSRRPGPGSYVWHSDSPLARYRPPESKTLNAALRDFNRRVLLDQPRAYAGIVAHDFARGFAADRGRLGYPVMLPKLMPEVRKSLGVRLSERTSLTGFLRSYGRHVHFPGPLFLACLVVSAAAVFGLGRARRSGLRSATGLFAGTTVAVLLLAVAVVQFSWRYQLPQLVLLPPAAALGLVALLRRGADPEALTEGRTLRALLRLPSPAASPTSATTEDRTEPADPEPPAG